MWEQVLAGILIAAGATLIAGVVALVRMTIRLFWRMDHLERAVSRLDGKLSHINDDLTELTVDLREHMAAEAHDVAELKQLIRETRHEPCRP